MGNSEQWVQKVEGGIIYNLAGRTTKNTVSQNKLILLATGKTTLWVTEKVWKIYT